MKFTLRLLLRGVIYSSNYLVCLEREKIFNLRLELTLSISVSLSVSGSVCLSVTVSFSDVLYIYENVFIFINNNFKFFTRH